MGKEILNLNESNENELELGQLLNKAELMKKVYYKGFGNYLQGIIANCANYLECLENQERESLKEKSFTLLSDLTKHYENFTDVELERIMPELVDVKNDLNNTEEIITALFNESSEEKLGELVEIVKFAIEVGEKFRQDFKNVTEKIEKVGGDGKSFGVFEKDGNTYRVL